MKIITSESVFKGHPDKICDQISDAILDECLRQDSKSRVAVECLIKDNLLVIVGEVTTKGQIDYCSIARKTIKNIGIYEDFEILEKISLQSPDIALGVDKDGAGDQGIMYGYASNECEELMPLPIVLARRVSQKMDQLTKGKQDLFGTDGKCQVSVLYDENNKPVRVTNIIVSQQTRELTPRSYYVEFITNECIRKVIPTELIDENTVIFINPTGEFVKGGSFADSGLTGRKIIVDTYGGVGRHGGGAFSGKDVTKVDRIGAYFARYLAKNVVASGVASKCEVQIAYSIGIPQPVAINVDTFGTSKYSNESIKYVLNMLFDFKPSAIKKAIIDDKVCFQDLASYGHVGRSDIDVPWERADKASLIKEVLASYSNE